MKGMTRLARGLVLAAMTVLALTGCGSGDGAVLAEPGAIEGP
ncbi:hypothetical protein Afil01_65180 [Actinorhabdospora filicis]|uniref:Uncharacterized protein n=1 Tax=Actinorhabdospora filicis TaxID=1785913 RepID=A0A9W6WDK7_9ACTN|nr:hypothetical protein Afil01_65180 [Actinorhabdospora filicis]